MPERVPPRIARDLRPGDWVFVGVGWAQVESATPMRGGKGMAVVCRSAYGKQLTLYWRAEAAVLARLLDQKDKGED